MPVALADLEIVYFDPAAHQVNDFDCGDSDLNEFLREDAWKVQADHISHTRLAFLGGKLVGYITLLADSVILKTGEKKKALKEARDLHQSLYTFPAIKIGRLGIQKEYQKAGVGTQLLKYTVGVVVRVNTDLSVGCRLITVDAYPESASWYESKGFVYNRHYGRKEKSLDRILNVGRKLIRKPAGTKHPSMRYDILRSPEIP